MKKAGLSVCEGDAEVEASNADAHQIRNSDVTQPCQNCDQLLCQVNKTKHVAVAVLLV